MTAHLSEEEQLEALKRWWNENGKSTLIMVILAVVGYFGWQGWLDQQKSQAEAASVKYDSLLEAVANPEPLSDELQATAEHLAKELTAEDSNFYGQNAALILAKLAVQKEDLEEAEQRLRWVLDQGPEKGIEAIAKLRLAQVLYTQERYDAALELLKTEEGDSFASAYAELRGDILEAQGKSQEARAAYQTAINTLLPQQNDRSNLLQMKLDDLAVVAMDEAIDEAEPSALDSDVSDGETKSDVEAVEQSSASAEGVSSTSEVDSAPEADTSDEDA